MSLLPTSTHTKLAFAPDNTQALVARESGEVALAPLADATTFEIVPSCDEVAPVKAGHQKLRLRVATSATLFLEFSDTLVKVADAPSTGFSRCFIVGAAPCENAVHFESLTSPDLHMSVQGGKVVMQGGGHDAPDFVATSCFTFVPAPDPANVVENAAINKLPVDTSLPKTPVNEPAPTSSPTPAPTPAPSPSTSTTTTTTTTSSTSSSSSSSSTTDQNARHARQSVLPLTSSDDPPTDGYGANEVNGGAPLTEEERARILAAPLLGENSGGIDFSAGEVSEEAVATTPSGQVEAKPAAEGPSAVTLTIYILIAIAVLVLLVYAARRFKLVDRAMQMLKSGGGGGGQGK